jgi:hypothetical protein
MSNDFIYFIFLFDGIAHINLQKLNIYRYDMSYGGDSATPDQCGRESADDITFLEAGDSYIGNTIPSYSQPYCLKAHLQYVLRSWSRSPQMKPELSAFLTFKRTVLIHSASKGGKN